MQSIGEAYCVWEALPALGSVERLDDLWVE
jgi:hypothetical protein